MSEDWFQAVVDFANAKGLPDKLTRVDRRRLGLRHRVSNVANQLGAEMPKIQTGGETDHRHWVLSGPDTEDWDRRKAERDQVRVRDMLRTLSDVGPTPELWERVVMLARGTPITGFTTFTPTVGSFISIAIMKPRTISQWYAFALAEMIAQGMGTRVGECGLPSCSNFYVNRANRGPRQRFCSKNHGSQDRMAAKRRRDAEKRRRLES